MSLIWILAVGGDHARIFKTPSSKYNLSRVNEIVCPQARLKNHDFDTDRPGRTFSSADSNLRHGFSSEVDSHSHVMRIFASDLCQMLEREYMQNHFDELILVADPSFLGMLKAELPKNLSNRVIATLGKNLAYVKDHEMVEALKEMMQELAGDPHRWQVA